MVKNILINSAKESFKCKKIKLEADKYKHQPWFNHTCLEAQKQYYKGKKINNKIHSTTTRITLLSRSRKYVKHAKRSYSHKVSKTLRQLKSKNPKDFYKILTPSKTEPVLNQPSAEEFEQHFCIS